MQQDAHRPRAVMDARSLDQGCYAGEAHRQTSEASCRMCRTTAQSGLSKQFIKHGVQWGTCRHWRPAVTGNTLGAGAPASTNPKTEASHAARTGVSLPPNSILVFDMTVLSAEPVDHACPVHSTTTSAVQPLWVLRARPAHSTFGISCEHWFRHVSMLQLVARCPVPAHWF